MSDSFESNMSASPFRRAAGIVFFALGLAVFLVRLHHDGPYGFPADGNLRASILALALGAWFSRPFASDAGIFRVIHWATIAVSPVVLFFASYAVLAELEEVIVIHTVDTRGEPVSLRLWVMDAEGVEWVNMPRSKAEANGLSNGRVEYLRAGQLSCRKAALVEDRQIVARNHRLGAEKYAVKRFAIRIGVFGEEVSPDVVSIRLDPCESA